MATAKPMKAAGSTLNIREMKAADIMHKGVETISSSATVVEALRKMQELKLSSLIVERRNRDDAFGLLTKTDIVKKVIELRETDITFSLKRYVTENPYKTFMVLVYAVAGAAGLYMDGSLTFYTAVVTGAAANSFSGKGAG